MKLNIASIFALAVAASTTDLASALKENCIEQASATVYEAAEMSPQNIGLVYSLPGYLYQRVSPRWPMDYYYY